MSHKNQGPIKTYFVLKEFEKKYIQASLIIFWNKKMFKIRQKDFRSTCPAGRYQVKIYEKDLTFRTV